MLENVFINVTLTIGILSLNASGGKRCRYDETLRKNKTQGIATIFAF